MKALILGIVVVAALVFFLFRMSRYSSWRPGRGPSADDGFGNHAEQRFLEEEHPATMSGPNPGAAVAATRESKEKGLGYWG